MIPVIPPARGGAHDGAATLAPRYEDIAQDDRMHLTALVPGLAAAVWYGTYLRLPAAKVLLGQGILPVLRRLVLVGEDRPVSVHMPVHYEGALRFAREAGGDRIFANMWVEARAPVATSFDLDAPADAPSELVGRAFAEHVMTRIFAPPRERTVTHLDAPGLPPVPEDHHVFEPPESLADGPLEDAGNVCFGLVHTDPNRHVNSLVYPRVFGDAVVRKLSDRRREGAHLLRPRALELRWRRPFSAGERARVAMRVGAPSGDGATEAVGAFFGGDDRPNATIKLWLR
jgi:hypothetical protein